MGSIEDAQRYLLESRVLEVSAGRLRRLAHVTSRAASSLSMGYLAEREGKARRGLPTPQPVRPQRRLRWRAVPKSSCREELQAKPPPNTLACPCAAALPGSRDSRLREVLSSCSPPSCRKKQKTDDDARGHLLLQIADRSPRQRGLRRSPSLSVASPMERQAPAGADSAQLQHSTTGSPSSGRARSEEVRPEVETPRPVG